MMNKVPNWKAPRLGAFFSLVKDFGPDLCIANQIQTHLRHLIGRRNFHFPVTLICSAFRAKKEQRFLNVINGLT